jgi:hypothetical protein
VLVLDGGPNEDGHKALNYEEFCRSLAPCGRWIWYELAPLVNTASVGQGVAPLARSIAEVPAPAGQNIQSICEN